jgi:hypothetical protein
MCFYGLLILVAESQVENFCQAYGCEMFQNNTKDHLRSCAVKIKQKTESKTTIFCSAIRPCYCVTNTIIYINKIDYVKILLWS